LGRILLATGAGHVRPLAMTMRTRRRRRRRKRRR